MLQEESDKMCIVVCVKQVKMSNANIQNRFICNKNDEIQNNPSDLVAISWAMNLKEKYGFKVVTVSMGPRAAIPLVKQLYAYGVDRAILLTSPILSGSDTYATSYALATVIKSVIPEFRLIVCGNKSLDGETGQVPHSIASELEIISFPNVTNIIFRNNIFEITYETETTKYLLKSGEKLLVTVSKQPEGYSCFPRIKNILQSENKNVEILSENNIELPGDKVGYKGSYTKVVSLRYKTNKLRRSPIKMYYKENQDKFNLLLNKILSKEI